MIKHNRFPVFCTRTKLLMASVMALTVFGVTDVKPVFAQGAAEGKLEEVIVTARRREEGLQSVPVTVTALSGEEMEQFAIHDITAASERVPGVMMFQGGSGQGGAIYVRGIGSYADAGAFEPSAALNFDGVVVSTARLLANGAFDLDSFEVLKGPQPLFFGKGATGGVISLRTRDPGPEFEGSAMVGYEFEEQGTMFQGVLSGPLTDTFGARFAVHHRGTDEYMENVAPEVKHHYRNYQSTDGRLTFAWQPMDTLNFNWKFNYSEFESDGTMNFWRPFCLHGCDSYTGTIGTSPYLGANPDGTVNIFDATAAASGGTDKYLRDGAPYTDNTTFYTRLLADWDINDSNRLVSTTGWLDLEDLNMDNYTFAASAAGTSGSLNKFEVFTQELRLEGESGRFKYMFGGFYESHKQDFNAEQYVGLAFLFPADTTGYQGSTYDVYKEHSTDSETWSLFGSLDFAFTDKLSMSVGGRYTDIERDGTITIPYANQGLNAYLVGGQGITTGPGDGFDDTTGQLVFLVPGGVDVLGGANQTWHSGPIKYSDQAFTPELVLNYSPADNSLVYLSWKKAFKPGGIDNGNGAFSDDLVVGKATGWPVGGGTVFDSEEVQGFELGWKSQLLDDTLRINAAAFDYEFEDLQVQIFRGFSFSTENAGKVKSQGIETDLLWVTPVKGLSLNASVLWDNSEFDEYTNTLTDQVLDGRRLGQSPEWSGNLGFDYNGPMFTGVDFNIVYDMHFTGEYFTDIAGRDLETGNTYTQNGFETHDLSISLMSPEQTWQVTLAGRNLTDQYYTVYSGFRVATGSVPFGDKDITLRRTAGRTVALLLKYNF